MDQCYAALLVPAHGLALPLFRIGIPLQCAFPDIVDQLLEHSFKRENRQRRIRDETLAARRMTCVLFIEGLHQAFSSQVPHTAVAFSHSQRSYKKGDSNLISKYSYRNIDACYQALLDLSWVTYCPGFVDPDGQTQPTTIAATGKLRDRFQEAKPQWRRVVYTGDPIIVRSKDDLTGSKNPIAAPNTPEVNFMRQQMNQINEFLCDQAIHLNLPNGQLKALAIRMASRRYSYNIGFGRRRTRARVLNFMQVGLRRIFAKGRLDRGGRLYGGWWQTIPNKCRRFISINGRPTVEVDFSEMHPSMLYILDGQQPPENIYDLGILQPGDSQNNTQVDPYNSKRGTVKRFLNALINDERGRHRLSAQGAKRLGVSHEQLKALVLEAHPVIRKALGTDTGLYLQYLDSQIACRVMLRLMEQGIVALPVHDSFLVQSEFERELIAAMREEFSAVMGAAARLKAPELPKDGFASLQQRGDLGKLINAHQESLHDLFVRSWREQHKQPTQPNLSPYAPYRFPDGVLTDRSQTDEAVQGYYVKQ